MVYLVTVKLPKNPAHNPNSKVTGKCPVNGNYCSDTTGEHHTVLIECNSLNDFRRISRHSYRAGLIR